MNAADTLSVGERNKSTRLASVLSPLATTRVACGMFHTSVVACRNDIPQLFVWGKNHNNILGLGPEVRERAHPKQVEYFGKSHVWQVSCGLNHTAVLIKPGGHGSGKLYTFGLGNRGRLGYRKSADAPPDSDDTEAWFAPKPYRLRFPDRVRLLHVDCGADHSLAISEVGRLYSWGVGSYGALGSGNLDDRYTPEEVCFGSGKSIVLIHCSGGGKHSLAVSRDGRLWSWGDNQRGKLGLGHNRAVLRPTAVDTGRDFVFVSAGESHSAAIDAAGRVYTWGDGSYGRLGHGDDSDSPVPRRVERLGGAKIRQISCGTFHTLAVSDEAELYSWGSGFAIGVSADGNAAPVRTPTKVTENLAAGVCQAAAGVYHSVVLTLTGDVLVWGVCGHGRLSVEDHSSQPLPRYIPDLRAKAFVADLRHALKQGKAAEPMQSRALDLGAVWKIVAVACGDEHSLLLTAGGTLLAAGSNAHGQLGFGDKVTENVVKFERCEAFREPLSRIAAGAQHSLAASCRGELFVWGSNRSGQLGLGTTTDAYVPAGVAALTGVFAVAAGSNYSAALVAPHVQPGVPGLASGPSEAAAAASAGTLWTWGAADDGRLGHRGLTAGALLAPRRVELTETITQVACGESHTLACTISGKVFAWGGGYRGKLGIGSSANSEVPVRALTPPEAFIVQVAACSTGSLAVTQNGVILAWGSAAICGSRDDELQPVRFALLDDDGNCQLVSSVAAAGESVWAVGQSGVLWGWGRTERLGLRRKAPPVLIAKPEQIGNELGCAVREVAAGGGHCLAALVDGNAASWGDGRNGQLGQGKRKGGDRCLTPERVIATWIEATLATATAAGGGGGGADNNDRGVKSVDRSTPAPPGVLVGGPSSSAAPPAQLGFELRLQRYLHSLRLPPGDAALWSFAEVQELLAAEPLTHSPQHLREFEDDVLRIFGRFIDAILSAKERENAFRQWEYAATLGVGQMVVNSPVDAPASLAEDAVGFPLPYTTRLNAVQTLVGVLHLQPAYLLLLNRLIGSNDDERELLTDAATQILSPLTDRGVAAAFLALAAAVAEDEVERCADLLQLFEPKSSLVARLLAHYMRAADRRPLRAFAERIVSADVKGSLGHRLEESANSVLCVDPVQAAKLLGAQEAEIRAALHASLATLAGVVAALPALLEVLPPLLLAVLQRIHKALLERDFAVQGPSRTFVLYPLARLTLQILVGTLCKDPLLHNRQFGFARLKGQHIDFNFRTLWVFLNAAFEDDFAEFKSATLLRQVFVGFYNTFAEALAGAIANTPPGLMDVELTLALYMTHLQLREFESLAVRTETVAGLILLLRRYLSGLQLSVYDPLAEALAAVRLLGQDTLEHMIKNPRCHNLRVERRFMVNERNVVFDAFTGVAVPQRLSLRQQAATKDGGKVLALVKRLPLPDAHDPRVLLEAGCRAAPPLTTTGKTWESLAAELQNVREYFTRLNPPKLEAAQAAQKAAKVAAEFEQRGVDRHNWYRFVGSNLERRAQHRNYLELVARAEDTVAETMREYQATLNARAQELEKIAENLSKLRVEPQILTRMAAAHRSAALDALRDKLRKTGRLLGAQLPRPALQVRLVRLRAARIVSSVNLTADDALAARCGFISDGSGGWSVQVVSGGKTDRRILDAFTLTPEDVRQLDRSPQQATVAFGKK